MHRPGWVDAFSLDHLRLSAGKGKQPTVGSLTQTTQQLLTQQPNNHEHTNQQKNQPKHLKFVSPCDFLGAQRKTTRKCAAWARRAAMAQHLVACLHGHKAPSSEPRFGKDASDASVVMTSWIRSECCVRLWSWFAGAAAGCRCRVLLSKGCLHLRKWGAATRYCCQSAACVMKLGCRHRCKVAARCLWQCGHWALMEITFKP